MAAERITLSIMMKGLQGFRSDAKSAERALDGIGHAARQRMGQAMAGMRTGVGQAGQAVGSMGNAMRGAVPIVARFGATAGLMGVAAAGAAGMAGLKFASMREQSEIAFTTMLGSGAKAKSFMDDLTTFAANTPFELPGLIQSSQQLLAFGFESKKVLPMLTSIGNAAGALGTGEEGISGMTMALGQMQAKGKASAEEMMQLAERGVPAWDMLAKALNTNVAGAMEQVSKGTVSADVAIGAITKGMDKRFGGMMEKQSKTLGGLWSTVKDGGMQAAYGMVEPFVPAIKSTLSWLIKAFNSPQFKAAMQAFGKYVREGMQWVVETFRTAWPGIQRFFNAIRPLLEGAVRWFRGMFLAVKGIIELFAAIISGDWSKAWQALKDIVRNVLSAIWGAVRGIFGTIINFIAGIGGKILDGIKALPIVIGNALKDFGAWIGRQIWEGVKSIPILGDVLDSFFGSSDYGDASTLPANMGGGAARPGTGPSTPVVRTPGRAWGGTVKPWERMTLVGERGPEVVSLPSGSQVMPLSTQRLQEATGRPVHIAVQLDRRTIARAVYSETRALAARA